MKIGIFGGSFNPPHKAHLDIARLLLDKGYLDKVIFVPTGSLYKKDDLIEGRYRLDMVKLMINGYEGMEVSDYEVVRGDSKTYDTLSYFRNLYFDDDIYFVCGTDNLREITSWSRYKDILLEFGIIVVNRQDNIKDLRDEYKGFNVIIVDILSSSLSATEIRGIIEKDINSKKLVGKLDNRVFNYIVRNNLYRK